LKETTAPAVAALGEDERAAVDEVVGAHTRRRHPLVAEQP